MASRSAVAGMLAYLHELFPTRPITDATGEAWSLTFEEWDDDELLRCAKLAARDPGRTFFPTPGEIIKHAREKAPVVIDTDAILSRISKLGRYNPNTGWIYPSVWQVREVLGDAIADAYADAGQARLFSEDETSQRIARQRFATVAREFSKADAPERVDLLETVSRRLAPRNAPAESIAGILQRALPKGES